MPTRLHEGHTPPVWWDRPLSHPWSLTVVGTFWTVTGLRLFNMIAESSGSEDGVVANVPIGAAVWLATMVTLGGFLVILAMSLTIVIMGKWMGIPVSTSQAVVGAVVGAGLTRGVRQVHFGVFRRIAIAWISSPTVAGLATYAIAALTAGYFA